MRLGLAHSVYISEERRLQTQCAGEVSLKGFLGEVFEIFKHFGDPSGISLGILGALWGHPELNKFGKIGNCAHRGVQEGVLEAPRVDFGAHFGSLFDIIQQLLTRHCVRRTWKEQERSIIAMKQRRTKK